MLIYAIYWMTSFQDAGILEPLEDGLNALLNIEVSGIYFSLGFALIYISYVSICASVSSCSDGKCLFFPTE